jgi:hypothetical protein
VQKIRAPHEKPGILLLRFFRTFAKSLALRNRLIRRLPVVWRGIPGQSGNPCMNRRARRLGTKGRAAGRCREADAPILHDENVALRPWEGRVRCAPERRAWGSWCPHGGWLVCDQGMEEKVNFWSGIFDEKITQIVRACHKSKSEMQPSRIFARRGSGRGSTSAGAVPAEVGGFRLSCAGLPVRTVRSRTAPVDRGGINHRTSATTL